MSARQAQAKAPLADMRAWRTHRAEASGRAGIEAAGGILLLALLVWAVCIGVWTLISGAADALRHLLVP